MRMSELLRLSYVPRWSILPFYRAQTVSDHSWRVAVIVREILRGSALEGLTEAAIVRAAFHDEDEALTGDMPSTTKPMTLDFSSKEKDLVGLLVSVADRVETRTWRKLWAHPSSAHRADVDTPRLEALIDEIAKRTAERTGADLRVRVEEITLEILEVG